MTMPNTLRRIKKFRRIKANPNLHILFAQEAIESLNTKITKTFESVLSDAINNAINQIQKEGEVIFSKILEELETKIGPPGPPGPNGLPGDAGYTPIKGVDYFDGKEGATPDILEVAKETVAIMPKPQDGKDGSPDTGKEIVEKINKTEVKPEFQIDAKHIKNLRVGGKRGGGGMGSPVPQTFACNGVLTSFTLNFPVSGDGNNRALWAYYNGQWLVPITDYTISGKTFSTTFTPENNTSIDVLFFPA